VSKVAIYNPYFETKGGGEKVCLALAESLQRDLGCEVYLVSHKEVDVQDLSDYFKLDLSNIRVMTVDFDTFAQKVLAHMPIPGRIRNIISDWKVSRAIKKGNFDMFINNCYQSNMPSPIKNSVYMCMFPQRLKGNAADISMVKRVYITIANFLSRLLLHPGSASPIDTYQRIVANSAYTQSFITKLWGKDSMILYPICDNMAKPEAGKEKLILHVGRFFANVGESHHKRQDFLLESFAKLTELHKDGWRLCFAGSVAQDVGALQYILTLLDDARGLPVDFRFNSSFADLRDLFNDATIYWHATGFGSDPEKHPERQEHFGITTVEAMSAGAIPVVINSAGQKESVIDGETGYLWDDQKTLIARTEEIIAMPKAQQAKLRDAAIHAAKRYDSVAFRKNVDEVFGDLISA